MHTACLLLRDGDQPAYSPAHRVEEDALREGLGYPSPQPAVVVTDRGTKRLRLVMQVSVLLLFTRRTDAN